jgi:hypothetical protein
VTISAHDTWEREKAAQLLEEHKDLRGAGVPGGAEAVQDWNIRAQTLLTFAAMHRIGEPNKGGQT